MSHKLDLSIIATFHNEGIIAHKTMLNILELVKPLEAEDIKYEIILHIDNGDAATLEYLSRYGDDAHVRIFKNSFGNPSDSRNFAAQEARGEYLAFLDGDDIISNNWLIDGYRLLKSESEPVVLHPEMDVSFGETEFAPRAWHMSNARSLDEDTMQMFTRNRWCAGTMLPRSVALEFPYKQTRDGFGYEDWVFNMDTRQAGIRHLVVPESVKFYRVRGGSTYALHGADNAVTYYSEMFSTPNMQRLAKRVAAHDFTIQAPPKDTKRTMSGLRRAISYSYDTLMTVPGLNKPIQHRLQRVRRRENQRKIAGLPPFLLKAWTEANQIEGELYPSRERLEQLWYYNSDYNYLTAIYCRLVAQMRQNPDYLFLTPQLKIGGTEKVVTNYLNAFAKLHPDWHIVVLSSIPKQHFYKIPDNVDFVDFFEEIEDLEDWERDFLLSRLIIQTQVKRLHIIHNDLAFRWARDHASLLGHNDYKIYVSQFMYEYNKDPALKVGFVDPYIREIYPLITKIFTDNQQMIDEMAEVDAFDRAKMSVHYQPVDLQAKPLASPPQLHRPLRILWASRVSDQKRPDLLKKIAERLNPEEYIIDAYGRFQKPYNTKFFAKTPTIHYKGTYNGIEALDLSHYDLFLYTSQTDGLPNVLLEICSLGLPVVASNVGGVSDIITPDTGYPVEMDDIDAYLDAIKSIQQDPATARVKVKRAQKLVKQRHSFEEFCRQVERDIN